MHPSGSSLHSSKGLSYGIAASTARTHWRLPIRVDDTQAVTADVPTRCLPRLFWCITWYTYQIDGGVPSYNADADVSYDISIQGFLPYARTAGVDERSGKN